VGTKSKEKVRASELFFCPRIKRLRALWEGLESNGLQAIAGSRHVTEANFFI
jgi:hypothetical protein